MMPSSSQVHDHQLIFQINSGFGHFHHWQKRGEERRGEERGGQTKAIGIDENSEQLLPNIE
jgi:hypothetical protein